MQRLWWVFCLLGTLVAGCASSVPVECPEGSTLGADGADCDASPTDEPDAGPEPRDEPDGAVIDPLSTCQDAECDDGNECTVDACDGDECVSVPAEDGTTCVFEDGAGFCDLGVCVRDCEIEDCRKVYPCSEQGLRDAIDDGGEVVIGCNGPTTVSLENGELDMFKDVSIDGLGLLTVDAEGRSRVFVANETARVELVGMNITGGNAATEAEHSGGGVFGAGTTDITIRDCRIYGNQSGVHGGGVRGGGTLRIEDTEIYDNTATERGAAIAIFSKGATILRTRIYDNVSGNDGGGVYVTGGAADFYDCTIERNQSSGSGGGIWASGPVLLDACTLRDNLSGDGGGGMRVYQKGSLTSRNGTLFENNTAVSGGAIATYRGTTPVQIEDTRFIGNKTTEGSGGAIFNDETPLVVSDSVFEGNRAASSSGAVYSKRAETRFVRTSFSDHQARIGGGFRFLGNTVERVDARFENCTISGSHASESGGTFFNARSTVILSHTTLTESTAVLEGDGAHLSTDAELHIQSSVFDAGCYADPDSFLVSLGYNAVLTPTTEQCTFTPLEGVSTDLAMTSEEMALGALGDNGGGTRTHLPEAQSLLIDAIPAESCLLEVTDDQRGEPRSGGSPCDIGAVEVQVGE